MVVVSGDVEGERPGRECRDPPHSVPHQVSEERGRMIAGQYVVCIMKLNVVLSLAVCVSRCQSPMAPPVRNHLQRTFVLQRPIYIVTCVYLVGMLYVFICAGVVVTISSCWSTLYSNWV